METPTLTRRRSIAFAGTALAVSTGGLTLTTRNARAQAEIQWGALSVPEKTVAPGDNEAHAIWAVINGAFKWSNLKTDPDKWGVYLLVGDGDGNWSAIGIDEGQTTAREYQGTFAIRGDITAASAYSSEDFQPNGDGTARSLTLPLAVMLVVRDGSGGVIAEAEATRDVPLTIEPGGSISAIGASGELVMQDDSDSSTPSLSGGL